MATYVITEKHSLASIRKGAKVEAASLEDAKCIAEREQMFQGTVLTIETEGGALLAVRQGGQWEDVDD